MITYATGIAILGAITLAIALLAIKKSDTRKKVGWVGAIILFVGIFTLVSPNTFPTLQNPMTFTAVTPSGDGGTIISTGEAYQPTASYSAKDKYSTTAVSGTSYYKVGNLPATTTAKTNVKSGETYTYWVENGTYYVKPVIFTAHEGANDIVADAWQNGSVTITGYDLVNHETITGGAYNTSMGANDQANIQFTYQGTAKQSAGPFGGVMALEYNSTISSVLCTGDQITEDNPYHVTYSVSDTSHTYKLWAYTADMDDGSGNVREINCQFKNGATAAGAGASYKITFIPANYYVTNAGDIVLDTEKFANDDTTRTGYGAPSATFYWAA